MSNTILQAQDLVFGFAAHQIFKQFSVNIPAGITYVVGDESSGKSTLLRLFAGNLLPQAGSIAIGSLSQTNDLASYKKTSFGSIHAPACMTKSRPTITLICNERFTLNLKMPYCLN